MRFLLILLTICFLKDSLHAQIREFSELFRVRQSRDYIPDLRDGRGVAFRDLNEDSMPDIYMVSFTGDNRLLINSGAYRPFKDMTAMAHLDANPRPQGVYSFEAGKTIFDRKYATCVADFDNDGDADIVIAGWGISTSLFRNDGRLRFTNITNQLELFPPVTANACVSADINNDGLADLFFTESRPVNRLFRNRGEMEFSDVTIESGLNIGADSRSAAFCDIDNDGDQDLYVANWGEPDLIYRNNGHGYFTIITLLNDVFVQPLNSSCVSFGDLDNDGDYDMVVTTHEAPDYILLNQSATGDSTWVFEQIKLNQVANTNSVAIGDFDNNGWQDIFLCAEQINRLYLGRELLNFAEILHELNNINSMGIAYADFDIDGDLDVFVTCSDNAALFYQNNTNNQAYVKLHLAGVTSNLDAIGASVQLTRAGPTISGNTIVGTRYVSGGAGSSSVNEQILHFGTDTLSVFDAHIFFPGGRHITEYDLKPGNTYVIHEFSLLSRTLIEAGQHMLYLTKQAAFWYQVILSVFFFVLTFIFIRLGLRRYRWTPATASAYIAGFFFLALIAIVALKKLGLLYNLLTINVLTILFVVTVILYSERLLRLRNIRRKYRSVLLDLTNQIVNIHDDSELLIRVVENLKKNTAFKSVIIIPVDSEQQKLRSADDVSWKFWAETFQASTLFDLLRQESFLNKTNASEITEFFSRTGADYVFSAERNGQFYALLLLGDAKDESSLDQEDVELFKSIVNQMAIAMENNEYIRRSNEMIKKLTAAEVREKYLKELELTNAALDSKNRDLQKLYDELRNTQTQLIHSEKMASLGQLVAGISHELNNPIGFIYANVKQLKTYTARIASFIEENYSGKKSAKIDHLLPDIENLIEDTISGSKMIKDLVENLRRFSHLDRSRWSVSNIHEGIESSLRILLPQYKDRIQIHTRFQANGYIECNAGQLNQVFLNILTNAAQAISGQGNIWIETEDDHGMIRICIRDDGKGMSSATQQKIFDPFFTTKDVGEGTGLGLSISYSIIQNHNGRIEVESAPDQGSTFTIILPHQRPEKQRGQRKAKEKVHP